MGIFVETNESKLNKNDVIIFDGKKWMAVSKSEFLLGTKKAIESTNESLSKVKEQSDGNKLALDRLTSEMAALKESLEKYSAGINKKLKEYHDILNILVGGEDK